MLPRPSSSTLFPYTTLFRSLLHLRQRRARDLVAAHAARDRRQAGVFRAPRIAVAVLAVHLVRLHVQAMREGDRLDRDRKSTRLNSSHSSISYAVFCLKKKNI